MNTKFTLHINNIDLYCRHCGKGDSILMIHGAGVDSDFFSESAQYLSSHFSVTTYDRRGYGRSTFSANEDYSVKSHAMDAATLIRNIGQPCHIVAHSAGSLIAMELAVTFPKLVRNIILYEPTAPLGLRAREDGTINYDTVLHSIQEKHYTKALNQFFSMFNPMDSRARAATEEELKHMDKNYSCFLKKEFLPFIEYAPDYNTLSQHSIKIGIGELSRKSPREISFQQLSKLLNCETIYFPGSHNCPFDLPKEFSYMIQGILG